ncbi:MAG: cation:proton antiporter [Cellulosimicrobium funkei]|uniref:Cation:proton antiporter n=1 Tax=Cellulosimicrobium cellulans TaxID=1710 RepID=A0AAV5P7D6_CELCE|nr:cation:proton antiporter [Cellulosimicrobium cellulans]QDP74021.1 cation:proton antiporter [Cellulosimicrobium cellulans]GLY57217.1 potassium transporter Kef [Cellulosimicrobium cellulans]
MRPPLPARDLGRCAILVLAAADHREPSVNVYAPLVPVFVVALLAPLLTGLMPVRSRVPQVVVLLLGGILVGPSALDLATPDDVTLLSDLGMGFLFLLAGYELEPSLLRERVGRRAGAAWLTSLVVGAVLVLAIVGHDSPHAVAAGAIALTTTALGVVLPILRDGGQLGSRLGRAVLVVGAVGELGPIVAMAVLLGTRESGVAAILLVLFAVVAVALSALPGRLGRLKALGGDRLFSAAEHGTGQSTLRLTVLLLVVLLALAAGLGFDAVLGAFVGGMVLRRWAPGDVEALEKKLDAVAWGVFVPVFFVSSGMGLDIDSIVASPLLPLTFFALMVVVRGGPVLLWFRRELPSVERVQTALYAATALPLLVALTEIAVEQGAMTSQVGAALVGAGVLSVIVLPMVASRLGPREPGVRPPGPGEQGEPGPRVDPPDDAATARG